MRLPLSKPWRAFPELDRFSDAACREYIRADRASAWYRSPWVMIPVGYTAGFVLWLLATGFCTWAFFLIANAVSGTEWEPSYSVGVVFGLALCVLVPVAFSASVMYGVRDLLLSRRLRARLGNAVCPGCAYRLLGLAITTDDSGTPAVHCPECGLRIVLADHDIKPSDLMSEADANADAKNGS